MEVTLRRRRRALRITALLAAGMLSFVACGDDDAGGRALPAWLERVFPPPDSDALPVDSIQISYEPQFGEGRRRVRLILDGTDVTSFSRITPGRLVYEPGAGPVNLEPGPHVAEVQRVELEGDEETVVDTFRWSFRYL